MSTKKRAIRIEPTCVRKARAKEQLVQDHHSAVPAPNQQCVYESGKKGFIGSGVYEVKKALQHLGPQQTVDDLFIKAETGIDVQHEQNQHLLHRIMDNPSIEAQWHAERILFKRVPHLGIEDCNTLKEAIDSSWSGNKMTIATTDLANTYKGVEKDVERLVEDGDVSSLSLDGSSIYFTRLQGAPASSCVKDLWNGVAVPKGHMLQDALVSRKVLTREEVDAREARMKRERDKEKMEADQAAAAKKARKMPMIRKITNTHLQLPLPDFSFATASVSQL